MKRPLIGLLILAVALVSLLIVRTHQQRQQLEGPVRGSGTVEGVEIRIAPRIGARILAIPVREGDPVEAGQLLVELDCREVEAAVAEVEAALQAARAQEKAAGSSVEAAEAQAAVLTAQRSAARREHRRLRELEGVGAVTERDLDRAATAVDDLGHRLAAAEAQEAAAREYVQAARAQVAAVEAGLARARVGLDECRLVAPRSGVVQTRALEPGEVVLPGSAILTILDTASVQVTFYVPNADLGAAEVGREVEIQADAYRKESFSGRIIRVSQEAEFTPRNVQTREDRDRLVYAVDVRVENPDGRLRPGMPVEVTIPGSGGRGGR